MICILNMKDSEITGWIIATDTHNARRKAMNMLSDDGVALANELYRHEFPQPGKYVLPTGHIMLVDTP